MSELSEFCHFCVNLSSAPFIIQFPDPGQLLIGWFLEKVSEGDDYSSLIVMEG